MDRFSDRQRLWARLARYAESENVPVRPIGKPVSPIENPVSPMGKAGSFIYQKTGQPHHKTS